MNPADSDLEAIAARILAAGDSAGSISPISAERPGFGIDHAYLVSALIAERRIARGERPVGWKVGFTNRTIWDEYDVHAPIWGPMYDSTVQAFAAGDDLSCELAPLSEPRIEPEIVFRIAVPPRPGMDEHELLACIDGVGHGFELVQSVFPAWRFQAADTVAAFALHGRYRHGPLMKIGEGDRAGWLARLADFEIVLFRDGERIDSGAASNVLGGPLSALRHFVSGLADFPIAPGIRAGDLVTTGTVTRAFPVSPGETWRTEIHGLPLTGLTIRFH
jgi:2-keto-4-pentenoate hydratase